MVGLAPGLDSIALRLDSCRLERLSNLAASMTTDLAQA